MPGLQALEEAGSAPGCSAVPEVRGFLVLCFQPPSGSPRADALPRPRTAGLPQRSPRCPAGEHGGGHQSRLCVCVSVSHPAPWGCCTGMLCPPGSVHTVKSNCLKAVVLGFVFFPQFSPIPFTQLERRRSLVSALVRGGPTARWPQPALLVRPILVPLWVVCARRQSCVAPPAPEDRAVARPPRAHCRS